MLLRKLPERRGFRFYIHFSRRDSMGLDKAILHGKEKRKPYRGAKRWSCSCRNHGSCQWCRSNRTHKFRDRHPEERKDDV